MNQIDQSSRPPSNTSLQSVGSQLGSSRAVRTHGREIQITTPGAMTLDTGELPQTSSIMRNVYQRFCTLCYPSSNVYQSNETIGQVSHPVVSQLTRQQDHRIGVNWICIGGAAVCTGLLDSRYHDTSHANEHVDAHEHGDDHEHVDDHNVNETMARIMRQGGHIWEGLFTAFAGKLKVYAAHNVSDEHYNKFKFASSMLQTVAFPGTLIAAVGDLLHGDTGHAVAHFSQAFITLAATAPDLCFWVEKNCIKDGKDIALQEKRKETSKIITIASNFLDVAPSSYLAFDMDSPFYAIEALCNMLMGIENFLCFKTRKKNILVSKDELHNFMGDYLKMVQEVDKLDAQNMTNGEVSEFMGRLEAFIANTKQYLKTMTGENHLVEPVPESTHLLEV